MVILPFCNCATIPYHDISDLPHGLNLYSLDKQFKVKPEWYWRFRTDNGLSSGENVAESIKANVTSIRFDTEKTIGVEFIKNQSGALDQGIVIGDVFENELKWYVAKWNNSYFFIKEKDYIFAGKFEKYLLDVSPRSDPDRYYNTRHLAKYKYQGLTILGFLAGSDYWLFGYDLITCFDGSQLQARDGNGQFINKFVLFPPSPLLKEFCKNESARGFNRSWFPSNYFKTVQYSNQSGMIFEGQLYVAKYAIVEWGEYIYSLPYTL